MRRLLLALLLCSLPGAAFAAGLGLGLGLANARGGGIPANAVVEGGIVVTEGGVIVTETP